MTHDCVILPGFGGFVVHHLSARFDESDGTLLPPSAVVGFNAKLVTNDSLLAQSYVETYDYNFAEAQTMVEEEVAQLREALFAKGSYEIYSVGRLTLNAERNIVFEPAPSGVLIPKWYGLGSISDFGTAQADGRENGSRSETHSNSSTNSDSSMRYSDDNYIHIRIPKRALRYTAAACVIALIAFALPFMMKNVDLSGVQQASFWSFFQNIPSLVSPKSNELATTATAEASTSADVSSTPNADASSTLSDATSEDIVIEEPTVEATPRETFSVVLSSYVSESNALAFKSRLERAGLEDVLIVGEGKERKVICGAFENEADAQVARRSLAAEYNLEGIWVTKVSL